MPDLNEKQKLAVELSTQGKRIAKTRIAEAFLAEHPESQSSRSLVRRFREKVTRGATDACWAWTGATKEKWHYGVIGAGGKFGPILRANRVAWILQHGVVPDGHVCHSCDNPMCTNPAHLFLGNDQINLDDMRRKGRGHVLPALPGEANPCVKYTETQVRELRAKVAEGRSIAAAAREVGIVAASAYPIAHGTSWGHL